MRARGNSGALCSTVAASSDSTGEIDSACSVSASVLRSLGRWVGTDRMRHRGQAMKLRRECGSAGVRSRDTEWIR